jgi:DNA-binding response OmpR family regulator
MIKFSKDFAKMPTLTSPGRILVVEDEPMVAEVVERYLRLDGYVVDVVHDGSSALAAFETNQPDLIVLDLMLPRVDGMEVCRRVRTQAQTPIIMLTARGDEVDKLVGLEVGADDYITKPFSPRELAARVKAVLRRTASTARPAADGTTLRFEDLRINATSRCVSDSRGDIPVTAREFDLLYFLASNPGQVFTRDRLLESVWDFEFPGDDATVTVHMRRLRAKVEADPSRPRHLKTVWGVGYKFEA